MELVKHLPVAHALVLSSPYSHQRIGLVRPEDGSLPRGVGGAGLLLVPCDRVATTRYPHGADDLRSWSRSQHIQLPPGVALSQVSYLRIGKN